MVYNTHAIAVKKMVTVNVLKFQTQDACQKRPGQTAQTKIRQLLKKQFDPVSELSLGFCLFVLFDLILYVPSTIFQL